MVNSYLVISNLDPYLFQSSLLKVTMARNPKIIEPPLQYRKPRVIPEGYLDKPKSCFIMKASGQTEDK